MKFTVPASVTISGWIEIDAPSIEEAKKIADHNNDVGIDQGELNDIDICSVVHTDEIDYMDEEDKPEA